MARFLKPRRVQGPPLYYRGVPVVNLIPPEGRSGFFQQKERRQMLVRGALALVLAAGALTALNLHGASRENEQSLSKVTANLTRVQNDQGRVAQLESALAEVEQQKQRLQEDREVLTTQASGLVPALQEMFRSRNPEVVLISVKASQYGQFSVQGETSYVPALLAWQERLATSVANLRMVNLRLAESGEGSLFTFTWDMELVE